MRGIRTRLRMCEAMSCVHTVVVGFGTSSPSIVKVANYVMCGR